MPNPNSICVGWVLFLLNWLGVYLWVSIKPDSPVLWPKHGRQFCSRRITNLWFLSAGDAVAHSPFICHHSRVPCNLGHWFQPSTFCAASWFAPCSSVRSRTCSVLEEKKTGSICPAPFQRNKATCFTAYIETCQRSNKKSSPQADAHEHSGSLQKQSKRLLKQHKTCSVQQPIHFLERQAPEQNTLISSPFLARVLSLTRFVWHWSICFKIKEELYAHFGMVRKFHPDALGSTSGSSESRAGTRVQ